MNKRLNIFLLLAVAEVCRYFLLVLVLPYELSVVSSQLTGRFLRFIAAPQLLVPAALFFLWLDQPRYREYLPLVLLGKLIGLLSLLLMLPSLLQLIQNAPPVNIHRILGLTGICLVADLAISSIIGYLKLAKRYQVPDNYENQPSGTSRATSESEIETVENPEAD